MGDSCLRSTDTRGNKIFVTLEYLYGFAPAKTVTPCSPIQYTRDGP